MKAGQGLAPGFCSLQILAVGLLLILLILKLGLQLTQAILNHLKISLQLQHTGLFSIHQRQPRQLMPPLLLDAGRRQGWPPELLSSALALQHV